MYKLLPPRQFEHFYLLIHAIHLLLKTNITLDDIKTSERFFSAFVYYFDKLYPIRHMTINIHSLLHLPSTVLELGPLYLYSLFHFEDKNGYILKLIHGTQNIPLQLASAVSASNFIPILTEKCIKKGSLEEKFIKQCNGSNQGKFFNISENLDGIGNLSPYKASDKDHSIVTGLFRSLYTKSSSFASIKKSGFTIRSTTRTKETRRNSTTVSLKTGGYFSVDRFACFENEFSTAYVAFGNHFTVSPFKIFNVLPGLKSTEKDLTFFNKVVISKERSVIDVRTIDEQSILLEPDENNSYVCHYPNILECD